MNITTYLETALPPSPERDELLALVRLGLSFQRQHKVGKRPGPLKTYLLKVVGEMEAPITFEKLLEELELEAARRNMYGIEASPIEKLDRVWELLAYHHPKNGRQQITFKTVRNQLAWCKLNLNR